MSEVEYIVSLKRGVDADAFNQEMIASSGAAAIPNRTVDIADARELSVRLTHYSLTAAEAESLKADSRVVDVEIPPQDRDDVEIGHDSLQEATFTKTTADSGDYRDWGKIRHSYPGNVYGAGSTTSLNFPYALDGTGVDVVIQDSGIQVDHPEFNDANGASRVQLLDWGQYSSSVTQSANHYRDYDGHGTHCAGTAVGLNYGWGKNARIYSQKLSGLEGAGDSGTGISITYAFDVITAWHNAKPIDPITGVKRPTIVNMSWGYSMPYTPGNITAFTYRGVTYNSGNDGDLLNSANQLSTYGFYQYLTSSGYRIPLRVSSVDTNIQEMIDAGIHVCVAAGNNRFKADLSDGLDYNNTVSTPSVRSYHRGSSPTDDEAISVGSLGYGVGSLTEETKSVFSTTGPGVDIYAAGEYIISATSTTNKFSAPSYYGNASFKQTNISGTSMASPQVCGLGALHLQANPHWTPAQLKDRLTKDTEARLQDGGLTAYGTHTNIMGGNNRIMLSRYANAVPFSSNVAGLKKR